MNHSYTYEEIKSQTKAWENAISATTSQASEIKTITDRHDQIIFTGCGSTYYLSLAGAALYQSSTGKTARAVPGSELLLNTSTVLNEGTRYLLIVVSRSGTTTETLKAIEKFKREKRGEVIVINNYETTMSQLGDLKIIIPDGQEQSVAQTRSFASMYVAVTALCAIASGKDELLKSMATLPATGNQLMTRYESLAKELGENLSIDRFYFLGSGIRYGLACEVNLKMKEMTLTHSEPFHFLEFRHGPMSMVNNQTAVVGLVSEKDETHELKVLAEMKDMGGKIITLGENGTDISFNSGVPEPVQAVLYLPVLQLMAFYRSIAKGLNPDKPKNLTAVVKLNFE